MSPRLVSTLSVAGFGLACTFVIWFATRERLPPEQVSPARSEEQASRRQGDESAAVPPPQPRREATAAPAAAPAQRTEVLVTPLFDESARLEVHQQATLRFQAHHTSGEAATGVELSVSVQAPGKPPLPLPVRELGLGIYEAGFVPPEPGELMALLTVRGQSTRSVRLSVIGPPDETADAPGPGGESWSGARHRGGGATHRGR